VTTSGRGALLQNRPREPWGLGGNHPYRGGSLGFGFSCPPS